MTKPFANSQLFKKNVAALFKVDEPLAVAMRKLENMGLDAPLHLVQTNDDNFFDAARKERMYEDVTREFKEKKPFLRKITPSTPCFSSLALAMASSSSICWGI